MKQEDLMVGDWVKLNVEGQVKPEIIKVSAFQIMEWYKDIESILLTDEVFEKSGFEEKILEPKSRWREFYLNDGIIIWETLNGWVIGSNSDDYHGWFRICYVHELQHILKVFGIEKEIVL